MSPYATFRDLQHDLINGTLTCRSLVAHYLQNINSNAHLNAFLSVYEEEALTRADDIDRKIKNGTAGKLAGLVVGIKDMLAYAGHPLQAASKILKGYKPPYNSTLVQRLLDADALIIGRQNCDEFGMGSSNENSAFGKVLNGLDTNRVPGGSSGGSAVAVQMDMCRISLGSDTGGSVRQPAAFCGVIGLKPTYSRISRYGLVAYASSFDCIGIIGTHPEDIALVLEVVAGNDDYDSTVSSSTVPSYSLLIQQKQEQPFTIGYIQETLQADALQPEIRDAVAGTIEKLKAQGHAVKPVTFPYQDYLLPTYYILATAEASSNLSRYDGVRYGYRGQAASDLDSLYKKSRSEGFGNEVKRRILLGNFVLTSDFYDSYYTKAQQVRRLIRESTRQLLTEVDVLLTPATPTTAFPVNQPTKDPVETYLADIFSVQANVAGVPAISVPCGKDEAGLPIGLQAIANDFMEDKLLRFATLISKLN
ncbi:MAG: Asp-tRNA(Asn)/Glu-tRNA(Gln) amidotransferase subunit GatA [Flammeovirgaceae bacterium]|nr:MAG: Asp-tRNA(Asn)/Glu-tRNA(Gln) amidotransferase subunit GatA [Flammeovirgaceae bacterium]